MNKTRNIVFAGLLTAIGVILPMAFHSIPNAGAIFLPMHIPVLLCGMIVGYKYGLLCGLLTPIVSYLLTGMPPGAILPIMIVELGIYGLTAGILKKITPNNIVGKYITLIGAMISGRIVSGLGKAFIFNLGSYSIQMWVTSSFITALPGIIIQLIAIPLVIIALEKSGLITSEMAK